MAINKMKLFERTRERWPLDVHVRPIDGVPCFVAEPCLINVHEAIEASCALSAEWTAEDNWTVFANWSFHQALWSLAEGSEEGLLHRDEVTFLMFKECMQSNLSTENWKAERLEYEESPSRFH